MSIVEKKKWQRSRYHLIHFLDKRTYNDQNVAVVDNKDTNVRNDSDEVEITIMVLGNNKKGR